MPSTNGHGSKPERVALYLRVSSEEQRDKETIKTQRVEVESYCRLHGLEVVEIYADDGVSGTIPLHERPEGRRLLEDARAGKFDSVVCYKLDRVGRSLLNVVDAHDRLEALGVGLRSAKEQVETTTPAGRLQFKMLAGFAEFERGTIRERTQDGLHRALRAGKQPGRIPYGYRIGDDGSFEVVEDEARIVAQIFANIAEGSTIYREVRRLNDEGVPAPGYRVSGKERVPGKRWNTTTVSAMLASPTYVGKHEERDRYIRLCAQGYIITEGELDGYLADLRIHTDNLNLLLESVEADLAARHAETELAASTEAWLMRRSGRVGSSSGSWSKASSLRTSVRVRNPESVSPTGSTSPRMRTLGEMVICMRCPGTRPEFLEAKAQAGR